MPKENPYYGFGCICIIVLFFCVYNFTYYYDQGCYHSINLCANYNKRNVEILKYQNVEPDSYYSPNCNCNNCVNTYSCDCNIVSCYLVGQYNNNTYCVVYSQDINGLSYVWSYSDISKYAIGSAQKFYSKSDNDELCYLNDIESLGFYRYNLLICIITFSMLSFFCCIGACKYGEIIEDNEHIERLATNPNYELVNRQSEINNPIVVKSDIEKGYMTLRLSNCGICLEEITQNSEQKIAVLKCGHVYCQICIDRWTAHLKGKLKCPVCENK